jgi:hypothetical protein
MTKVTIVKEYRNTVTLRQMELSEIVSAIQNEAFCELCKELRDVYPLVEVRQKYDAMDGLLHFYTKGLPKVCFSSQMENRNKQRVMKAYNGLVLLEVNNLASFDEAEAVRRGASQIPHTLLAFVGASGRSVKIVCWGELFDGGLPVGEENVTYTVNDETVDEAAYDAAFSDFDARNWTLVGRQFALDELSALE